MQPSKLAHHCVQAVALTIFAYQMIGAISKYFTFSSVVSIDTKDSMKSL